VERNVHPDPKNCPRCAVPLKRVELDEVSLCECEQCAGLWVDKAQLERIIERAESEALASPLRAPLPRKTRPLESVRYIRCPVCANFMSRYNFADSSGAIIDSCQEHGTWFDQDELRHILEFVRAGGLERERQRRLETRADSLQSSLARATELRPVPPEITLKLLRDFPEFFR
jgi:Zn-finger nucleic acid-binding protein